MSDRERELHAGDRVTYRAAAIEAAQHGNDRSGPLNVPFLELRLVPVLLWCLVFVCVLAYGVPLWARAWCF